MPMGTEGALMGDGFADALVAVDPVESVIERVLGGEREAFEDLMAMTEMKVLSLAWRLLGDRELARDAAQEVFLRIYRSLDRYRLGEGFHPWMFRITANVCADLARKRGPLLACAEVMEEEGHGAVAPVAEDHVLLEQRRHLVRRALQGLTPAERSALVLRDLEGLSTEDAAKALGVRPVTIRSQISSARAKMQAFCARVVRPFPGGAA